MWTTQCIALALIGAQFSAPSPDPVARVAYGDLALGSAPGRATLRQRLADTTRTFCQRNRREVTPDALRHDPLYCQETVRLALLREMPREIRSAYAQALREAGVRGRRL